MVLANRKGRNDLPSPRSHRTTLQMHLARSSLMETADRAAILMMSRSPLAYGRRLLSAMATEELARRAAIRFAVGDCGEIRASRVAKIVLGRRAQVIHRLTESAPMESSGNYIEIIDALRGLYAEMQALCASEAVGDMLKLVTSKKEEALES